jgi:hypothetical protein
MKIIKQGVFMNITDKILSIPPYISSSWKNIVSIHVEPRPFGHALIVELITNTRIEIPNLDRPFIEKIFASHAKAIEEESKPRITAHPFSSLDLMGMHSVIQHDPQQKDTPPLPMDMLEKIAEMAKGLLPIDFSLQQPEANCNCPYCQIMRALTEPSAEAVALEEEVSDEDLKFRVWDIKQEDNKLYSVTNSSDNKEQYKVFLGTPIGCSCGSNHCKHIQAVLNNPVV